MSLFWELPNLEFEYSLTEYKCPECGTLLTQPELSTMLACTEGHGPYFLI